MSHRRLYPILTILGIGAVVAILWSWPAPDAATPIDNTLVAEQISSGGYLADLENAVQTRQLFADGRLVETSYTGTVLLEKTVPAKQVEALQAAIDTLNADRSSLVPNDTSASSTCLDVVDGIDTGFAFYPTAAQKPLTLSNCIRLGEYSAEIPSADPRDYTPHPITDLFFETIDQAK